MSEQRCCEMIHNDFGVGFHRCSRKGVVERDGKPYCRQHDPVAVKARRDETDLRRRQERNAADEKYRRERAALAVVDGIPTEALESPEFAAAVREAAAKIGGESACGRSRCRWWSEP